ncbi:MAG: ABC-type Zn uptake system ZnuABC Zn-binding protein ZnuA, partial [Psychrobacter glaciei]
MSILSFIKNYKALMVLTSFLLVGCGEELQGSSDENAITSGTPFAYVARDIGNDANKWSINSQAPDTFNPGARLYVR